MQLRILKGFRIRAGNLRASSLKGMLPFPDAFSRLDPSLLDFLFRDTPQSGAFGRIQDGIANVAELCRR
jgi:hypothetical protein